jgi:Haem-binding domain
VTKTRKRLLIALAILVVLSVLSWPSKSDKAKQPILSGAQLDAGVLAIFERSCQDCHSEKTYYPWYSYVAPVSLLIANDVSGGRRHMNLSEWQGYSLQRRERLLSEIANQVKDRDMPLTQYTLIHRHAKLSDADVKAVFDWTQKERARLIAEGSH